MNKNDIFAVIKKTVLDILPELDPTMINITNSLRDLGANSLDRAEILIQCMSTLQLRIPLVEFGQVRNIEELITIFLSNYSKNSELYVKS